MSASIIEIRRRLIQLQESGVECTDIERRTTEVLRVNLTQEEIVQTAGEMADAHAAAKTKEQDLAHLKKELQAKIESYKATADAKSENIRNGYELRNVECVDVLEHPRAGRKTRFRLDTLEVVEETAMTDSERQRVMQFSEK